MSIIVTGGDGYVGWPTALRVAARTDERVVIVDNLARRKWVEEVGSRSAVPVASIDERLEAAREVHGLGNLSFVEGDLTERSLVDELLQVHEPSTILHVAAQPSAPYANMNGERANYTQHNNMQATRNLAFGLAENDMTDTHLVETTTTGVYGAPEFPIPEGGAVMENQGERDEVPFPAMAGSWYHQCYDDQTEILTREGWKRFENLESDDRVMSMDSETGETSWRVPSEIQEYDYSGEMVTFSNRRIDLKVTPNHRMLIGTSWAQGADRTFNDRRKVVRADELGDEYKHPCLFTALPNWEGERRHIESYPPTLDDAGNHVASDGGLAQRSQPRCLIPWLEFFGWWLTEGSVGKAGQNNNVRIYQSDTRGLERLFEKIGYGSPRLGETENADYLEVTDKRLASYLRRFTDDRHIPEWMRNLPNADLRILFDALMMGDGTRRPNKRGWTFYTSSERLADHVQEIALKLGHAATVNEMDRSDGDSWQKKPEYKVGITNTWCVQTNQQKDAFGREEYDGKVYCCTVDGGIVLVRRNGFPVWSGNSKCHDAANLRLAHKQFGIPISDVRTAIVYGAETDETRVDDRLKTRLDFDYYFGVVAHRFAAQAVAGYPLTVYGKGLQRKPFISLEDAVEGLARLATMDPDGRPADHTVYNQVTRPIAIVELAETIQAAGEDHGLDVEVTHVENPRDEDEEHEMEIENDRYMDLIGEQAMTWREGASDVLESLLRYQGTITDHEDRFLPAALQEEAE
jgi:nucleoside-diphosphate-sugar epimerase